MSICFSKGWALVLEIGFMTTLSLLGAYLALKTHSVPHAIIERRTDTMPGVFLCPAFNSEKADYEWLAFCSYSRYIWMDRWEYNNVEMFEEEFYKTWPGTRIVWDLDKRDNLRFQLTSHELQLCEGLFQSWAGERTTRVVPSVRVELIKSKVQSSRYRIEIRYDDATDMVYYTARGSDIHNVAYWRRDRSRVFFILLGGMLGCVSGFLIIFSLRLAHDVITAGAFHGTA